jgi:hypothetical protein
MAPPAQGRADFLRAEDDALLRQCEVDRFRASGPGGQHRNKTESAVRLRHQPTGIVAHSTDFRSQHENKLRAVRRLREHLALDLREPVSLEGYSPPPALATLLATWSARRGEKTMASTPYLLAVGELLDLFVALNASVADTATRLGVSTGSLSKFFLADDRLARKTNEERSQRGMKPLK